MTLRFLALLVVCASHSAWAQRPVPWPEPLSAPWPLADVAVQGDSINGVTLLAWPNPTTPLPDSAATFITLHLPSDGLRAWTLRARRFLDSARSVPGDIQEKPMGISISTDSGAGRLTLGFDHNARPTANFLMVLTPPSPATGWIVRGAWRHADQLLALLDSVMTLPPRLTAPVGDERQLARQCVLVLPIPRGRPRLDLPSRIAGQIVVQFVVDSTGTAIDSTVRVLLSSGPKYTAELQRHFGEVHFSPATCGGRPIALLVRQAVRWGPRR